MDKNCVTIKHSVDRREIALAYNIESFLEDLEKKVVDELATGIAASDKITTQLVDNPDKGTVTIKASVAVLTIAEYEYLKHCEDRLKDVILDLEYTGCGRVDYDGKIYF